MCQIREAHASKGASLMMKRLESLAPGALCDGNRRLLQRYLWAISGRVAHCSDWAGFCAENGQIV